ncbi:hypothetical protein NQ314_014739 [Rhamnusium bicolor]|uniref:Major facilitator superfamily (MFS) profile domain-containing protein n=1 Tax=Rhamnusium bicolor TaxID=1586634 RepID=A0AAV8X150_9CUCU|nr:hypothetical protein NQ314_014739 [Rhamnusium bicolor]
MGRKYTLLSLGVPFVVCYLMMAFGKIIELFYVARFIMGLAVGGVFSLMPIYACEVADKSNRGVLGFLMGSAVCGGLLFSCALGPYVSVMVFNLILAVFPLIFLILFPCLGREVPHYYVSINENDLAKEALQKLRGGSNDIDEELGELQKKFKEEEQGSFTDIFRTKGLKKAFATSKIFQEVGSNLAPEVCTIIIAVVQFISSFIAPLIGDRLGRKTILTFSAIGMAISEATLGVYSYLKERGDVNMDSVSSLPVIIMTGFIISYNSGYGPLAWSMLGELFPSKVKSIATSAVTSINWLLAFFIIKHFESMITTFGAAEYFWFYGGCCVLAAIFAKFYVIETRVELLSYNKKLEILKNGKNLKGTGLYVSPDLTHQELADRRVLIENLKLAREKQYSAKIVKNKLVINGKTYNADQLKIAPLNLPLSTPSGSTHENNIDHQNPPETPDKIDSLNKTLFEDNEKENKDKEESERKESPQTVAERIIKKRKKN